MAIYLEVSPPISEFDLDFSKARKNRFPREFRKLFENYSVAHDPAVFAVGTKPLKKPIVTQSGLLDLHTNVHHGGIVGNIDIHDLVNNPLILSL